MMVSEKRRIAVAWVKYVFMRRSTGRLVPSSPKPRSGARLVLELEGQVVLVAAGQEVQRIPHAKEEVLGGVDLAALALADHALHDQLAHVLDLVLDLGEPHRGVDVAEAAGAFLELGSSR